MRRRIPEDTYSISYLRKGSQEVLILLSYHKVSDDGVLKNGGETCITKSLDN